MAAPGLLNSFASLTSLSRAFLSRRRAVRAEFPVYPNPRLLSAFFHSGWTALELWVWFIVRQASALRIFIALGVAIHPREVTSIRIEEVIHTTCPPCLLAV